MIIQVLGCAGAELPGLRMPAFLVDGSLLLDAGTIGLALEMDEQVRITDICITHAHLDHIKAIPFFVDNVVTRNLDHRVTVHATAEIIEILRTNLFNGLVWPDFTVIPTPDRPVITYSVLERGAEAVINRHRVTAVPVTHPTPGTGFLVEDQDGTRLIYTGDTGPTEELWTLCDGSINGLIVEVSFPNVMRERALTTGHLTAELLAAEIDKMPAVPERVFITHAKPSYREVIIEEMGALIRREVEFLADGQTIELADRGNRRSQ